MHNPNEIILREYDIRGTYGENLFDADATWLGKSFGSLLYQMNGRKVVVCRDGRESSPNLHNALCESLIKCGLRILDIGIGTTPMSYFAGYHLNSDATLMITGSHNPRNDNGIKITLNNQPFFGLQIKNLVNQPINCKQGGSYTDCAEDVFKAYTQRLIQGYCFKKPLRIAWDAGNGAAGQTIEAIAAMLPEHQHILLFTEIDCNFPNHHPDPSVPKNLEHLIDAVIKQNCDIGFAFDGDGDRIGVVDSAGRIIAGDELVGIISKAILEQAPGSTIIADVKCGRNTFNTIKNAGGNAIMGRTGHSWIKQLMRERNAAFAGEMSGHMFFKHNYFGFDDGLYAAIFLIEYLQHVNFTDLVALLPKPFCTPEIRIECSENRKFSIVEDIKKKLITLGKTFNDIDGVRVEEPDGWWLVRASNTQSALIVRAESDTADGLEKISTDLQTFGINNLSN